jgi:phage terminase large subunit
MVAAVTRPSQPITTIRYWPRGASAELFRHHEPEVIISGPAGTGKTYGALWRLHLAALKYPGMRALMVRKTQEDLTASAVVTYQERVLTAGAFGVTPFGGSKFRPASFVYPNGSQILVGGLDKADKVMSRDYDLIYVNEAWEIDEDAWQKLTTRVNRPGKVMPYNQVFGDTNPQGPGHWIYKRCHTTRKMEMLWSRHEDNPLLWDHDAQAWTEAGANYLATLGNLSGHLRARLLQGKWVATEGVVYAGFDRVTHVKQVDTEGWRTAMTVDVGSRNPTAILTVRSASDERVHIERETYRRNMSSGDITAAVKAEADRCNPDIIYADPSAKGYILELQRDGYPMKAANNDVIEGIGRVTEVLANGFSIDPSCVNTIAEFESYRYPEGARAETDKPLKENDHALDAFRYYCLGESVPQPKVMVW